MNLIDKDALVAEIEKLKGKVSDSSSYCNGWQHALRQLEIEINTFEVKEVDLEKEIELVKGDYEQVDVAWNNDFDFIAKHFFELGLKVQNYNNKCEDLRDDGICNFATTKLGRTMRCENISCSRRNKTQKGE